MNKWRAGQKDIRTELNNQRKTEGKLTELNNQRKTEGTIADLKNQRKTGGHKDRINESKKDRRT